MLRRTISALAVLLLLPLLLAAQALPVVPIQLPSDITTPLCVLLGPVITAMLQKVKHIPFIAKNTFLIAAIASAILSLSPSFGVPHGTTLGQVIQCILATLGGSVATHRLLFKPEERKVALMQGMVDEADAAAAAGARRRR